MELSLQLLDPPTVLPSFHSTGRRGSPRPAIASRFQASSSAGYSPCSRHQALRVASSIAAVTITACSRATAVQRGLPAADPLAKASARQRSSVATLIPTSRDTKSIAELSGGNSLATIRSLYACPYRATFCYPRPQRFRSYLGGNFSDTGGPYAGVSKGAVVVMMRSLPARLAEYNAASAAASACSRAAVARPR